MPLHVELFCRDRLPRMPRGLLKPSFQECMLLGPFLECLCYVDPLIDPFSRFGSEGPWMTYGTLDVLLFTA